ncbi:MAG: hypothetical protein QXO32_03060 [Candidatus Bathyarchaeia archaeon]
MPSHKVSTLTLVATLLVLITFTSNPIYAARTGEFEVARIVDVVHPDTVEPGALIQVLVTAEYEEKLLIDVGLMDVDRDVILDSYTMISTFTGPGLSNFTFNARAPLKEGLWKLRAMTRAWWANSWYSDPTQGLMDFEVYVKNSTVTLSRKAEITITSNVPNLTVTLDGSAWNLTAGRLTVEFEHGLHEFSVNPIVDVNPTERWVFVKWSDNVSSPYRKVHLNGDLNFDAIYRPQYRVRVESNGGIISGDGWYWSGSKAYISALPTLKVNDEEWRFAKWTGSLESEQNVDELTVDSPKLVKAVWEPVRHGEVRNMSLLFLLCTLSMCSIPLTYIMVRRRKFRAHRVSAVFLTVMLLPYLWLQPAQAYSFSANLQLGSVTWRYWKNPAADTCIIWLGGGILGDSLRINPFWLESYNTRRFVEGLADYYSILAVEEGPDPIPQPALNRTVQAVLYRPGMLEDVRVWLKREGYRFIYLMGYSVGGIAVLQEALEANPKGWEAPNGVILITVPVKSGFKAEAHKLRSNLLLLYGEKMTRFYVDSGLSFFQGVPTKPHMLKEFQITPEVAHEVWTIADSGKFTLNSTSHIVEFIENAKTLYFNSLQVIGNSKNRVYIDDLRLSNESDGLDRIRITGQAWSTRDEPYLLAAKDHEGRVLSVWAGEKTRQINFSLHIPGGSLDREWVEIHAYWLTEGDLLEADGNPLMKVEVKPRTLLTVKVSSEPDEFKVYFDGAYYTVEETLELKTTPGIHNITVPGMLQAENSRLKFLFWTDGETQPSRLIKLNKDVELKAIYIKEHLLTVESTYGSVEGSGWCEDGALATLHVTPPYAFKEARGNVFFSGWSVENGEVEAYNGTQITVVVNRPMTVKANWYAVKGRQDTSPLIYLFSDVLAGFTLILSAYLAVRERRKSEKRNSL